VPEAERRHRADGEAGRSLVDGRRKWSVGVGRMERSAGRGWAGVGGGAPASGGWRGRPVVGGRAPEVERRRWADGEADRSCGRAGARGGALASGGRVGGCEKRARGVERAQREARYKSEGRAPVG
jgi:translation initiation factor IF-2